MLARDYVLVPVVGCARVQRRERGRRARLPPSQRHGNRIVRWKRAVAGISNPTTIATTASSSSSSRLLGDALLNIETGGRFPAEQEGRGRGAGVPVSVSNEFSIAN